MVLLLSLFHKKKQPTRVALLKILFLPWITKRTMKNEFSGLSPKCSLRDVLRAKGLQIRYMQSI